MSMDIKLAGGKYRLLQNGDGTGLRALRYGEEWRDLTGDNLVSELGHRIESLQQQLGNAMDLLVTAGGEAGLMNQDIESLQARAKELESLVNKIYNGDCSLTTASIIAANFIPTEQPE